MSTNRKYVQTGLAVLALTLSSLAGMSWYAAANGGEHAVTDGGESDIPKSCIQKDEFGRLIWIGPSSFEVDRLGDKLQDFVDDYPNELTGTAYCSDYSGVYVAAKNGLSKQLQKEFDKLKAKHPNSAVYVKSVKFSKNELDSVVQSIVSMGMDIPGVLGVGPDYMEGVVTVTYHGEEVSDPSEIKSKVLAGLSETDNVKVPIVMEPGLPAVATTES
ncbi:MAG: hypothetical protein CR979_02860 [Propionibacterium sp.]|nr:MAG: hypothetical protein CR979_02860 [Propionibacterium sp.]